jgi:pyridoxamine 5'-phosphate oxidase
MTEHAVPLREQDVARDPLEQFRRWYEEAAQVVRMPEAAAIATADGNGRPSVRMVLVKQVDERGFAFFTNYGSRKGRELAARPLAALLFYWDALGRQVRIEGPVERVGAGESDAYFATRPRGSQLSASASRQSRPVASRSDLEALVAESAARVGDGPVPRPEHWGGFRVRPTSYEFWQHRDDRLHDRLLFERERDGDLVAAGIGWTVQRLQP